MKSYVKERLSLIGLLILTVSHTNNILRVYNSPLFSLSSLKLFNVANYFNKSNGVYDYFLNV